MRLNLTNVEAIDPKLMAGLDEGDRQLSAIRKGVFNEAVSAEESAFPYAWAAFVDIAGVKGVGHKRSQKKLEEAKAMLQAIITEAEENDDNAKADKYRSTVKLIDEALAKEDGSVAGLQFK